MTDSIGNTERFKRNDDSHLSDFTEAYKYKKSTFPIIMDTTTSTNDGKKHQGYVDIQSKTTMMTMSSKMSKKRGKFKKFLHKIFRKKQNVIQKRNALVKLDRQTRFSPFKHLKKIFQGSAINKPSANLTDECNTNCSELLSNKGNNYGKMEKEASNPFENHLPEENNGVTEFSLKNKNSFPSENFGRFKIKNKLKQKSWKPLKRRFGFTSFDNVRKYSTLEYNPIYKTNDYIETSERDKEKLTSYNKHQSQFHDFLPDSSELPFTKIFNPFTPFKNDDKLYPSPELDPQAKFDTYSNEVNTNFGSNTKNGNLETIPSYDERNTYDAENKGDPKYENSSNYMPGHSISSYPAWPPIDSTDMQNNLDESKAHYKANTGKLNITLNEKNYLQIFIFEEFWKIYLRCGFFDYIFSFSPLYLVIRNIFHIFPIAL